MQRKVGKSDGFNCRMVVMLGFLLMLMLINGTAPAAAGIEDVESLRAARPSARAHLAAVDTSTMLWNQTYGGAGDEWAWAVLQTADGEFALIGRTDSYGAGVRDVWLVKTDASGNHQWNQTYGGAYTEWAMAGIQTADGGFALAGLTQSYGAGGSDFWLVKTDASGNHLWNQTYGGAGSEAADAGIQTADGGFALAGYTDSYGAGGRDFWLVKTVPISPYLCSVTITNVYGIYSPGDPYPIVVVNGKADGCQQVEVTMNCMGGEQTQIVTVDPSGLWEVHFDSPESECSCEESPIKVGALCVDPISPSCSDEWGADKLSCREECPCTVTETVTVTVPELEVDWFFALAGLFVVPAILRKRKK